MLAQIVTENGVKKIKALTADVGAGLPVGTWCSFENDVAPNANWIRAGTTFDASAYPVLASYLGTNVVPHRYDHNRPSGLNTFVPSGSTITPFTTEYDAEVIVSSRSSEARAVTVNGETVCNINASNIVEQITVSLKKGDILTVTGPTSTNTYEVTGFYYSHPLFIKATSGLSENQQDSVINALNVSRSYSTEEILTGKTWIDGKPIYRKCYKLAQDVTTSSAGSVIALDILNPYYTSYSGDVNEITKLEYSPKAGQAFFPYLTFYLDTSRQYIGIKSDGSSLTIKKDSVFILEYTKTTD